MDLNLIRDKIDVLDKEIVNLLEERFELVKSVADYKRENNMAVLDANRESRIIEKNIGYLENKDLSNLITKIFKDIFHKRKWPPKSKCCFFCQYLSLYKSQA